MTSIRCCNHKCKNNEYGVCTKDFIELGTQYMEDEKGKESYLYYCTDEE